MKSQSGYLSKSFFFLIKRRIRRGFHNQVRNQKLIINSECFLKTKKKYFTRDKNFVTDKVLKFHLCFSILLRISRNRVKYDGTIYRGLKMEKRVHHKFSMVYFQPTSRAGLHPMKILPAGII